jgi:hypothetical protein
MFDSLDSSSWASVLSPAQPLGNGALLRLKLARSPLANPVSGLFFMARCGIHSQADRFQNWNIYAPRPLFALSCLPFSDTSGESEWSVFLPRLDDPGYQWLLQRAAQDKLLLYGPYGNAFSLPQNHLRRALLVVADAVRMPLLMDWIHHFLDRGGRVTLILLGDNEQNNLLHTLPIQVEMQRHRSLESAGLSEAIRWADLLLAAVDSPNLYRLSHLIYTTRFRSSDEFAYAFVEADYLCGYGACLACTVPTATGGVTRACLHGPILPLSSLVST